MKYMIIKQQLDSDAFLPISDAIRMLNVGKSGYYEWLRKPDSDPDSVKVEMGIKDEMQKIAIEFPRYGYRRMTIELYNRGYHVNHKRVLRLMQEANLLCVKKHFKTLTTDSNHDHEVYQNLMKNRKNLHIG